MYFSFAGLSAWLVALTMAMSIRCYRHESDTKMIRNDLIEGNLNMSRAGKGGEMVVVTL
jgi:hypothetical protein